MSLSRLDMTVTAFHDNAFHMEVCEPLFDSLYRCLGNKHNLTIGSIWVADQAAQGTSGLLVDRIHGNDSSWFEHARDILTIPNVFRKRMTRPVVAVVTLHARNTSCAIAHMHPRLFEAVVLVGTPINLSHSPSSMHMLKYALHRPEAHETREQAEKAVRTSPLFKDWNSRVVQRYFDIAFHTDPIATVPEAAKTKPPPTKHAEASNPVRSKIPSALETTSRDLTWSLPQPKPIPTNRSMP